jgi:hypothetical protein
MSYANPSTKTEAIRRSRLGVYACLFSQTAPDKIAIAESTINALFKRLAALESSRSLSANERREKLRLRAVRAVYEGRA